MKVIDRIASRLFNKRQLLRSYSTNWGGIGSYPFGQLVFRNIVELLTDLTNDVVWENRDPKDRLRFAAFVRFFEAEAQATLWRVFKNGYAVIGERRGELPSFRLLNNNEYYERGDTGNTYIAPIDETFEVYVMRSDTFAEEGKSDYGLCWPFVKFLDNVLNASNTASEKMGTFIVASPESINGAPMPVVLNERDKKEMEKAISDEYGSLSRQRHIMLLPRGMNFQTISLEGIDRKLGEKVRLCVLAICDRIKVPANQVAIIDANSSNSLSNGGELREGDFNKYQSFERLLNHTFVRMTMVIGLNVTYSIYNKPARQ